MSLLKQWKGVSGYMFRDPDKFFTHYNEKHGVGYPLLFLMVTSLVAVVPMMALVTVLNITDPVAIAAGIVLFLLFGAWIWLSTTIEALLTHAMVSLFGGSGVTRTLEAYAFPSTVRMVFWWIPLVNLGMGLYGWYLQIKAVGYFHNMSTGKALAAALLGVLLGFGLAIGGMVVLAAIIASFVLDLGASGTGPAV